MTTVQYVCASSSRTIHGKLDKNTAWFEFHQIAHLSGIGLDRAAKLLGQVGATGEFDTERDASQADLTVCYLSHRAVLAVGCHQTYGRATAFRKSCESAAVFTLHH
ncbi:hypothetical protein [Paraburkholderia sp. PGU19]|uniref:hypothetical protein n=1 Tax=Paraburkholderia sp. PGU19 TaxID=2735434 RepID=UPI0015DA0526|nr:hypothetical protein [Paraburkholderia sp. PGU19]